LRVPSLLVSVLALALVAWVLVRLEPPLWVAAAFFPLALAPEIVRDATLARPYPLACALAVLAAVAANAGSQVERPSARGLRWLLATTASGPIS